MERSPAYLLTDDEYRPLGVIDVEHGRWIGRTTDGSVIFNRKDGEGAIRAGGKNGRLVVTTAWYGIYPGSERMKVARAV